MTPQEKINAIDYVCNHGDPDYDDHYNKIERIKEILKQWNKSGFKKMIKLEDILKRARDVTNKHIIRNKGVWGVGDQTSLVHSEVSEVFDVHRRPDKYENPEDSFILETCDIIFAALTLAHIRGYPDDAIVKALEKTLIKIEDRVKWLKY